MKAFLRAVLDFLERKFPDRVVVTEANYTEMKALQAGQAQQIVEIKGEMAEMKLNLLNLNQAIGFAAPKMGMLER